MPVTQNHGGTNPPHTAHFGSSTQWDGDLRPLCHDRASSGAPAHGGREMAGYARGHQQGIRAPPALAPSVLDGLQAAAETEHF